ncbi:transient receptor potential cation channel subfamily M member-like 2 [Littorina saxatilis]|uniref:transient receptor potential cation channel subfamily M member-like 2 n=1 Tax=Littorina saxatilis TaxID=31220 RepID=UPI0038B50E1E
MLTRSKLFIAQEPCRQQLTREWNGHHDQGQPLCPCRSKRRLTQPDPATTTSCHGDKGAACKQAMQRIVCYFKRPKSCYWISLVWQIAFLALYSYVLLFDLRDIPSPAFIALMVCVADTAFEEIRQLLTSSMKVGGKKDGLWTRVKAYWSQKWNKLDVFSVAGFVLGVILVFAPNQAAHRVGRVVLAVDVFVFFLRFLQIFMVFRDLGLLLVMAERMVKDSARFMVILLTVMLGYVVASESVLYPDMHFSWPTLYRLPSRAFGQTFAELGMQEIQQGDCDKDGVCPSSYGQYVVPVMLAIYVIATHVLLLNLLIARFNATFEAVKKEAERHQAWQYCQLVQEYKNRSLLPPPCNILRLLITPVIQLCAKRCLCCLCCQGPRDTDPGMEEGERMPLTSLREEESMTLTPSAQGKCVTISSRQAMKDFTLELTDTNNVFQSAPTVLGELDRPA